ELPSRESVSGEALMHEAEGADHVGVVQLGIEIGDLGGEQQSLIYDGAGGERRNVEESLFGVGKIGSGDLAFGAFADDVQLALELVLVHAAATRDEDLLDI